MLRAWRHRAPQVGRAAYCHPGAEIVGRVSLGPSASVWAGAVLRGDIEPIRIGPESNVQDGVLMHTSPHLPVVVGRGVTIGHGAILHGARVGDYALIGMGAILLDGCVIGKECLIGAGTLVPEGKKIPARSLVLGSPGRVVRRLKIHEVRQLHRSAKEYVHFALAHRGHVVPLAAPPSRRG